MAQDFAPEKTLRQQLTQRYRKIILSGSALLCLACAALTALNYQTQRANVLNEISSHIGEYGRSAASASQLAENHVKRLKQAILNYQTAKLSYDTSRHRALFQPISTHESDAHGYATKSAAEPELTSVIPQILAKSNYFETGGSETELNMLFTLAHSMHEGQQTNSNLVWSYFFSGNENLVAVYPWIDTQHLVAEQNYADINALVDSYYTYEIAVNSLPKNNPKGEHHWSEPYVDAGGKGLMVSHIAPIHYQGRYLGLVGTDLLLTVFNDFIAHFQLGAGRLWMISPNGTIIADSGNAAITALANLSNEAPWFAKVSTSKTTDSPINRFQNVDGYHVMALPVPETPWTLVYAVNDRDIFQAIYRRLLPFLGALLFVVISFMSALWMLRRILINPAISLAGYIHHAAQQEDAIPPQLPSLWAPLAQTINTTFKRAHENIHHLAESENLKSGIINAAPVCIISANTRGEIIEFNPEAERCFGHRAEDVVGRNMTDIIIPPRLRDAHSKGFKRFCESRNGNILGQRVELTALHAKGNEFPVELNIVTSLRGDDLIITAFIVDLTERKRTDQELRRQRDLLHQSEKLNAMGSLLANVAHELNNPLAVVVGRSVMLEEQLNDTPHGKAIVKVREAAERCVRIVRTFLAMARQKEQEYKPTQINEVLLMSVDIQKHALKTSGIALTLDLASDLPVVQASSDQLGQVFLNLIVNAQQAMAEQNRPNKQLHVRSRRVANQIQVSIEDNGPGVAEGIRSRIFEPYFTTKPMGVGTGVGLPVSLGIAQAHGGDIAVSESPLGGARFLVTLPITEAAQTTDHAITQPTDESMPNKQTRILIVDDEPEISSMLGEIIAELAHHIDYAEDGLAALDCLAKHRYDAIVSDLRMPNLDGEGLYKEIQEHYPNMASRMIFITGDALSPNIAKFLGELDAPVLEKPFVPNEVKRCIGELLKETSKTVGTS